MQSLSFTRWSRRGRPPKDAAQQRSADIRWGFVGVAALLVVFAVLGLVYVVKLGISTYTAHMSDAAAVRAGDEIRLAGITVGNVKSLEAKRDHVEMRFTVDSEVFVGDQSSLDVRMLTIVGGHYVALVPAGNNPLTQPIPVDRVILPYSLPKIFQDAIKPVREIDGEVLRNNLAALDASLRKSPQSLNDVLQGVNSVVDILNQQNRDVSRAFELADEYLTALQTNPEVTRGIIRSLKNLADLILTYIDRTEATLRTLADVVTGVAPLARAWETQLRPHAQVLADVVPLLDNLVNRLRELLATVLKFGEKLRPLLPPGGGIAIDQSGSVVTGLELCIPMPGRKC